MLFGKPLVDNQHAKTAGGIIIDPARSTMIIEPSPHPTALLPVQWCALVLCGSPCIGKSWVCRRQNVPAHISRRVLSVRTGPRRGDRIDERPGVWTAPWRQDYPVYDIDSGRYGTTVEGGADGTPGRRVLDTGLYMAQVQQAVRVPNAIVMGCAKPEFREALRAAGIKYVRVFPHRGEDFPRRGPASRHRELVKQEWLRRQEHRGRGVRDRLWHFMNDRWEDKIMEIDDHPRVDGRVSEDWSGKVLLDTTDYLVDCLPEILHRIDEL